MPPLLMKVPLAALEVPLNCVCPPLAPLALATMPPLLMKVPLAAVELTLNCVSPPVAPATAPPLVTKVCVVPELFVTPTPLMVNIKLLLTLIVKASAPGLNTTPLTSVLVERKILVILEVAKVAVSAGPLGTTLPVQLVNPVGRSTKFQSPLRSPTQVPLSAKLDSIVRIKRSADRSRVMEVARMQGSFLPD